MATTAQLTAELTYTDGSTEDVTASASWSSSDETIATVDASGLVSAVAAGSATVTGESSGFSDTCAVTVTASPEALAVSPDTATLDAPA